MKTKRSSELSYFTEACGRMLNKNRKRYHMGASDYLEMLIYNDHPADHLKEHTKEELREFTGIFYRNDRLQMLLANRPFTNAEAIKACAKAIDDAVEELHGHFV